MQATFASAIDLPVPPFIRVEGDDLSRIGSGGSLARFATGKWGSKVGRTLTGVEASSLLDPACGLPLGWDAEVTATQRVFDLRQLLITRPDVFRDVTIPDTNLGFVSSLLDARRYG